MVRQAVWIGIVIVVFFVGIGVSFAAFQAINPSNFMGMIPQQMMNQMMQNPQFQKQMMQQMSPMMNDPEFRQKMMTIMMQNPQMMQDMMQNQQMMSMMNP